MNNIIITINTKNTNRVVSFMLSLLADYNFGKVTISKYDRIGVVAEIEEIETDSIMYDELVDALRDLRKLNAFYKDRIEATLKVDVWSREFEYFYDYDNDWCGNIVFEEYGDLHMDEGDDE